MTNKILLAKSLFIFIGGLSFLEKERDRLFNSAFWRRLKMKPLKFVLQQRKTEWQFRCFHSDFLKIDIRVNSKLYNFFALNYGAATRIRNETFTKLRFLTADRRKTNTRMPEE
jgi:hypothetical protein